jgi:hypothetical protein
MLVLRLKSDGNWDLEMVGVNETRSLKKVKAAQTVKTLLRDTSTTTDTFYPMLEMAQRFGQPIWIDAQQVQAQMAAVRSVA